MATQIRHTEGGPAHPVDIVKATDPTGSFSAAVLAGQLAIVGVDPDIHDVLINRDFSRKTGTTTTFAAPITPGDYTFTVASAVGFSIGNSLELSEGSILENKLKIINLVGTTVTVDRQIDNAYTTAGVMELVVTDISSVAGTIAAPQIYSIAPPAGEIWHILRVILHLEDTTTMDDSKFGAQVALTNGVVFRENKDIFLTMASWKTNGDIAGTMFDAEYTAKGAGGNTTLRARWTMARNGAVIQLDGTAGDTLEFIIQDDITALVAGHMVAQGHVDIGLAG